MKRTPSRFSTRGSALLIVLWAIAMMSIAVVGIVEFVHYDLDETISLKKSARAFQLAESGVAVGLHPLVKKGDAVLKQTFGPGEKFEAHIRSEGGRLNINAIMRNGDWDLLHDVFIVWGMDESDAATVRDAFKDWATSPFKKEGGQTVLTTGSAQPGSTARPTLGAVRQFNSVEEMLLIPGMDLVAGAKPDWQQSFTLWSDGTLDVNEAPADLIGVVCGIGGVQARRFVRMRMGPDEKPDTEDDVTFATMEQVRQALGMSTVEFQKIQGRINLQDSVTRVESIGTLEDVNRKITVIARRNATPVTFIQWQEY